jgi:hypothetical protein
MIALIQEATPLLFILAGGLATWSLVHSWRSGTTA